MVTRSFATCNLVGHGRDGRVQHRLLRDHPDAVTKATVLDIAPFSGSGWPGNGSASPDRQSELPAGLEFGATPAFTPRRRIGHPPFAGPDTPRDSSRSHQAIQGVQHRQVDHLPAASLHLDLTQATIAAEAP